MQACIEKPDGRREPTRILLAHSDREIAQEIKRTLVALCPNVTVVTNEATLRLWVATEARSLGRGGVSVVAKAAGVSRTTVYAGLAEL
ncbi:MAG: hypothetical protein ACREXM_18810, partial [Gammaproteobacteria bacterium]